MEWQFFVRHYLTNNSISHEPIDRFAESKNKEVQHKLTNFDRVFSWNKNLNYFVCKLGLAKIGIWHDMTYEMKSTMIQNIILTLVYYPG